MASVSNELPDCLRDSEFHCSEAIEAYQNGVIHACFFLGEQGDLILEQFVAEKYSRCGRFPNWFYVEPGRYSPGVLLTMKRRKSLDGWERLFFCKHHTTLIGGPNFKRAQTSGKSTPLLLDNPESPRYTYYNPAQFHQLLKFIWYKANRGRFYLPLFARGATLINHIPNEVELTHKDHLARNIQEYTQKLAALSGPLPEAWQCLSFPIHPETLSLRHWEQCAAFAAIQQQHQAASTTPGAAPQNEQSNKAVDLGNVWIIKPDGGSRGVGIGVLSDFKAFFEDYQACMQQLGSGGPHLALRDQKQDHKTGHFCMTRQILQRYLAQPLLLDGHKFDVRTYLLIVNVEDELVFYHDGYIRVNAEPYDRGCTDLDNLWKHLSNVSVQRTHPNFDDFAEDMRWDFVRFQEHLTAHQLAPPDWVQGYLEPQMRRMMWFSFQSVKHKLRRTSPHAVFMMVGTDFIIDENLKIWLIEYSKSPAIFRTSNTHPLVKRWSTMIAEAAAIALEVDRRKQDGESFNLESNNTITSLQTWKSCRP